MNQPDDKGRMTNGNTDSNGALLGTLRKMFGAAHLGVTVAMAIFLWQEYQSSTRERTAMLLDIAVIKAQIASQAAVDLAQNTNVNSNLGAVVQRLDAQRADLLELRQELHDHNDNTLRRR